MPPRCFQDASRCLHDATKMLSTRPSLLSLSLQPRFVREHCLGSFALESLALGFFKFVPTHAEEDSVTFILVNSQHSSTWLGGKTYGGCLPNVSQVPPRCVSDDFQMPPDASQMPPDAFPKKLFGVSRWGNLHESFGLKYNIM